MARVLPFHDSRQGGKGGAEPDPEAEDLDAGREEANSEYLSLMDKSIEDILREGQKALFARLVSACRAGTATHQELAILRNILKDNGLTLGIPPDRPATGERLPLPDDVEVPEYGPPEQ